MIFQSKSTFYLFCFYLKTFKNFGPAIDYMIKKMTVQIFTFLQLTYYIHLPYFFKETKINK